MLVQHIQYTKYTVHIVHTHKPHIPYKPHTIHAIHTRPYILYITVHTMHTIHTTYSTDRRNHTYHAYMMLLYSVNTRRTYRTYCKYCTISYMPECFPTSHDGYRIMVIMIMIWSLNISNGRTVSPTQEINLCKWSSPVVLCFIVNSYPNVFISRRSQVAPFEHVMLMSGTAPQPTQKEKCVIWQLKV